MRSLPISNVFANSLPLRGGGGGGAPRIFKKNAFYPRKICKCRKNVLPLHRIKKIIDMKVYFIDKVQGEKVALTATSISDLEYKALAFCFARGFFAKKVYVHCSHVASRRVDECNVEYMITVNNQACTITTRRI